MYAHVEYITDKNRANSTRVNTLNGFSAYRVDVHADQEIMDALRIVRKEGDKNWGEALSRIIETGARAILNATPDIGTYRHIRYMVVKYHEGKRDWYCAYLEVPAAVDTENVECHGGVTYGDYYDGAKPLRDWPRPRLGETTARQGMKIIGWDYAHFYDADTIMDDVLRDIRETIDTIHKGEEE
jgi:hypothetical protein